MTATKRRFWTPCWPLHERFLTARGKDPQALEGIGVSATGQINSHTGVVAGTCGNLPNYIGSPIKEQLEAKFHRPVTVANDANCMCLGEVWVGGAKGYTDVIGVTLGTGVGGGILTGGRLLEGARGLGGEMGHFRLHALDGVACTCGAIGCYERYAATTALVRDAQKMGLDAPDGRAIFEAAAAGDARTLAVLNRWISEIAQGLAGLVHIFNPQLILRRRRQRTAGAADRPAGRAGAQKHHARLRRGVGAEGRRPPERRRACRRSVLFQK